MTRALILAATLLASPAHAATARLYTPGGAPCNGACTLTWAQEQFGVPDGQPVPLVIPAGSTALKMSYAKNGIPYWTAEPLVFADDQTGIGYPVGRGLVMARIDACMNWTLVWLATTEAALPVTVPVLVAAGSWAPPIAGTSPLPSYGAPAVPPVEPPGPSPIPLPASGLLLVLAVITLFRRKA